MNRSIALVGFAVPLTLLAACCPCGLEAYLPATTTLVPLAELGDANRAGLSCADACVAPAAGATRCHFTAGSWDPSGLGDGGPGVSCFDGLEQNAEVGVNWPFPLAGFGDGGPSDGPLLPPGASCAQACIAIYLFYGGGPYDSCAFTSTDAGPGVACTENAACQPPLYPNTM
ncbi:MAG: hypothetical protein ACYDCL_22145 [Myxococcales bacterium]